MSYYFPEGSKFYYSTTFASPKTITALSNASEAVASITGHAYIDGNELLISSGWDDVNDSVYKANQLTADTVGLVDLDTTNTDFFPPGTGTGTARLISAWTEIPQIKTVNASGGDPKYSTIALLARRNSFDIPTGFNAEKLAITMYHDPANATFKAMLGIGRVLTKCAFKQVIAGGLVTYGFGYMVTSERAQMNPGDANTVQCALSITGRSISYAS